MDQVKFYRGPKRATTHLQVEEGSFYYANDTKELLMVMQGELVQLDNSIYWVLDGDDFQTPAQSGKRIAYDFNTENLYIAYGNTWIEARRNAYIDAGTLML